MIRYSRGHIQIMDLDLIKQAACECNEDIKSHYRRMFDSNEGGESTGSRAFPV